jgi:hypothetical protein
MRGGGGEGVVQTMKQSSDCRVIRKFLCSCKNNNHRLCVWVCAQELLNQPVYEQSSIVISFY